MTATYNVMLELFEEVQIQQRQNARECQLDKKDGGRSVTSSLASTRHMPLM